MSFLDMVAHEIRTHPFLVVIIFFVAGSITTYGVKTYAEINDVNRIEASLQDSIDEFKATVDDKLLAFNTKLVRFENVAEQMHLQSQIDDINTELFNLQEVVLPHSNQPTKIKQQIAKYSTRKNKVKRKLELVEEVIMRNSSKR